MAREKWNKRQKRWGFYYHIFIVLFYMSIVSSFFTCHGGHIRCIVKFITLLHLVLLYIISTKARNILGQYKKNGEWKYTITILFILMKMGSSQK